jgi:hypothetical protein
MRIALMSVGLFRSFSNSVVYNGYLRRNPFANLA